jgi:protein-disulfide isomerase
MFMTQPPGFFQEGTPRVMFFFGLAIGVAAALVVNTAVAYNGGNLRLKGAEKVGDKVAAAAAPAAAAAAAQPDPEPAGGPVTPLKADDHIRGPKNAKVVMIEYSDYQCPFCERHHPTMQKLMTDFPGQVSWVFRHFPLSFHPNAIPAANAAECASEQNKFWEYTDALFADQRQDLQPDSFYEGLATAQRMNLTQFKSCYSSKKYSSRISNDQSEGAASGVNGTPATFINGKLVSGALPYESIKQMVQAALAQ